MTMIMMAILIMLLLTTMMMMMMMIVMIVGWSDIGYSFLVGGDGNVYEGRGWTHVGAHTQGYNSKAFAASMIGSFTSHLPTPQALTGNQCNILIIKQQTRTY